MARKRIDDRNLYLRGKTYYLRREIGGVVDRRSLKTGDLELASLRRDAIYSRETGMAVEDLTGGREKAVATVGRVIDAYVDDWHTGDKGVRRSAGQFLLALLRRAHGLADSKAARSLDMHKVTAAAVVAAQKDYLAEARDGNPADLLRKRRAFNSAWRKAKTVFTHREAFTQLNLGDTFESALKVKCLKGEKDTRFLPFDAAEGKKLTEALTVLKQTNPHLYLLAGMMFWCGARNMEAAHARRPWLTRNGDGTCWLSIRPDDTFKPKYGSRTVPVPASFAGELETLGAADFFTTDGCTKTARRDMVYRALNAWIKAILPGRDAYDMRKHAGSVVAKTQGIWAAQTFLGHKYITTTQSYYAGMIDALKPVPMESAFR